MSENYKKCQCDCDCQTHVEQDKDRAEYLCSLCHIKTGRGEKGHGLKNVRIGELEKEIAELKARDKWRYVKDGLPLTADKWFLTTIEICYEGEVLRMADRLRFHDGVWFDRNNKPFAANKKVIAYRELPAPAQMESEG